MAMNPMALLKLKGLVAECKTRHPRFFEFLPVASGYLGEGSLIEVAVTNAEGKKIFTNLKITKEDLDFVTQLQELTK